MILIVKQFLYTYIDIRNNNIGLFVQPAQGPITGITGKNAV